MRSRGLAPPRPCPPAKEEQPCVGGAARCLSAHRQQRPGSPGCVGLMGGALWDLSVCLFPPWNSDLKALAPSHGSADASLAEGSPGLAQTIAGRSQGGLHLLSGLPRFSMFLRGEQAAAHPCPKPAGQCGTEDPATTSAGLNLGAHLTSAPHSPPHTSTLVATMPFPNTVYEYCSRIVSKLILELFRASVFYQFL